MTEFSEYRSGDLIFDIKPPIVVPDDVAANTIGELIGAAYSNDIYQEHGPELARRVSEPIIKVIDEYMKTDPEKAKEWIRYGIGSGHELTITKTSLHIR
jgi:hypothetical protein